VLDDTEKAEEEDSSSEMEGVSDGSVTAVSDANAASPDVATMSTDIATPSEGATPINIPTITQLEVSTHPDVITQPEVSTHPDVITQSEVSTPPDVITPPEISTHPHVIAATPSDATTLCDVTCSGTSTSTRPVGNMAVETTPTHDPVEDKASKLLSRDELITLFHEISPVPVGSLITVGMVSRHGNCDAVSAFSFIVMYTGWVS
jgi:hypothetical protein